MAEQVNSDQSMGSVSEVSTDDGSGSLPKFFNVQSKYQYDEDLTCNFTLGSCCLPREGDRVSIYKVGWQHSNDYHLFDWVPVDASPNNEYTIVFSNPLLPECSNIYYEFCYTTTDNELLMRSKPFLFVQNIYSTSQAEEAASVSTMNRHSSPATSSMNQIAKELTKLREENQILRESLKLFVQQREPKNYDRELAEVKTLVYSLTDCLNKQRHDFSLLNNKVDVCLSANKELLENKAHLEERLRKYEPGSSGPNAIVAVERVLSATDDNTSMSSYNDYDVGDLEDVPPFPFAK